MSDLISRQKAIEALDFEIVHMTGISNDEKNITNPFAQYNKGLENGIKAIHGLPSVELERKKGEWVYDGIRGRFPACKCSICGHYENADWALLQGANYCPNCGADMRGEHE